MGSMIRLDTQIKDLNLYKLTQIKDERGAVYHYLKSANPAFNGFGESYFSKVNPGIIKGWKLHKKVFQNFCVPFGEIKIVVYDCRINSKTYGGIDEIILDDCKNYNLLMMPPNLWYSFKCISNFSSILANIIDSPYEILESINIPISSDLIPYNWE